MCTHTMPLRNIEIKLKTREIAHSKKKKTGKKSKWAAKFSGNFLKIFTSYRNNKYIVIYNIRMGIFMAMPNALRVVPSFA